MGVAHLGRYYIALWVMLGIVWLAGAFVTKRSVRTQSRESRIGHTLLFLLGAVLLRVSLLGHRLVSRSPAVAWAGLALTAAGLAFAIWARFDLGGNWSGRVTVKQDHTLVRSGPYAVVRHPIYTGFIAGTGGTILGIGEVRALAGFVVVIAGFIVKARLEEKFMRQKFGEEYASYQREVKALIPFVW
jgi:protein-S-isoprenylcysteine O-methyltransferase Ste14